MRAGLVLGACLSVAIHLVVLLPGGHPIAMVAAARPEAVTVRWLEVASDPSAARPTTSDAPAAAPPPLRAANPPGAAHTSSRDTPVAAAESEYVSTERLSQRPTALGTVKVPYPEVEDQHRLTTLVLTLFIDERGNVDRVQVDEPDAPAPFADAAKKAFAAATFTPGRRGDLAVKSQLRIEVAFESAEAIP